MPATAGCPLTAHTNASDPSGEPSAATWYTGKQQQSKAASRVPLAANAESNGPTEFLNPMGFGTPPKPRRPRRRDDYGCALSPSRR
jgi:hypothetical protein